MVENQGRKIEMALFHSTWCARVSLRGVVRGVGRRGEGHLPTCFLRVHASDGDNLLAYHGDFIFVRPRYTHPA